MDYKFITPPRQPKTPYTLADIFGDETPEPPELENPNTTGEPRTIERAIGLLRHHPSIHLKWVLLPDPSGMGQRCSTRRKLAFSHTDEIEQAMEALCGLMERCILRPM